MGMQQGATDRPAVVSLDDALAADPSLTGAKAANLARARAAGLPALPGVVLTTAWAATAARQDEAAREAARGAWHALAAGGAPVVVRSSSTGEDGGTSSMAGVFESVLDVGDAGAFEAAVATVLGSADSAASAGVVDAAMAVLVQPMVRPAWGGVLFGADPVTGRRDRLVVAAVRGGPAALVAGEVDGWTAVLNRRGRVVEVRSAPTANGAGPLPAAVLRSLARLAEQVARIFGGPQDVEWAVEDDGVVRLLQARPITTLAPRTGPVLGPGPVAETFPDPLSPLEQDLWLDPLRDGLREALRLAGTSTDRALDRSPIVVAVGGRAAADLDALGVADPAGPSLWDRFDPRPPARRLRAAWRVGRLRRALPMLAADLAERVDAELLAVPALDELSNTELLAILRNGRRSLVSLHGHEALAGLLVPSAGAATVTGAALALGTVAQAATEGVSLADLVEHDPVVLALVPPRIGPLPDLADIVGPGQAASGSALGEVAEPDPAAVAREALRLRVRWLQELTARAAWELGRRLVDVGLLPSRASVRLLTLDELHAAAQRRAVPADLDGRVEAAGRPLPNRFRRTEDGTPFTVPTGRARRRRTRRHAVDLDVAVGAGGGRGQGPVHVGGDGDVPLAGAVLVVAHLDPRLAPVIGRLAGLVAETGNPLSHLAILAREHGVPTVVGLAGATERYLPGEVVVVDGEAGTVHAVAERPPAAVDPPNGGSTLADLGAQP